MNMSAFFLIQAPFRRWNLDQSLVTYRPRADFFRSLQSS